MKLASLVELWRELVPAPLVEHTRLESLERGVLRVSCASSAVLFELDQQLRAGLQRELITRHSGPAVRRIQLLIGSFEDDEPTIGGGYALSCSRWKGDLAGTCT